MTNPTRTIGRQRKDRSAPRAVMAVLTILGYAAVPAVAQGQAGQVFAVTGEWSAASEPEVSLASGGLFDVTDSLVAPYSPLGSDRIVIWFETGRISCHAGSDAGVECNQGSRESCAVGQDRVISIAACLTGTPSTVVRLMSVVMRAVGEDPKRYWPLLTRSAKIGLHEDVVLLQGGGIRLDALDHLPAGRYRVCARALTASGARHGTPRCGLIQVGAAPQRVASPLGRGLVEVEAVSMWHRDAAWVLVVGDDEYELAKAAIDDARRVVESWTDVDDVERRAVLRAYLSHLASSRGRAGADRQR